jgi:hypothetical protein
LIADPLHQIPSQDRSHASFQIGAGGQDMEMFASLRLLFDNCYTGKNRGGIEKKEGEE